MKKIDIKISYSQERLKAINQHMEKKDTTLESELLTQLDKIYEKFVPPQVREYIEYNEKTQELEELTSKKRNSRKKMPLAFENNKLSGEIQNDTR